MDEDFVGFAPPPFQADQALQKLRRALRSLGLSERAGLFELRGKVVARAAVQADGLQVAIAKRPARSPEWQPRGLKNDSELRQFVADIEKRLAQQDSSDD
jgi:hypothetical protein